MEALPAGPGDQAWLEALARDPAVAPFIGLRTDIGGAIVAGEMYVLWEAGTRVGGVRIHVRHVISRIGVIHTVMITPGLRGRGMGLAAAYSIVTLGFGELKLHRLEAEVYANNEPALRTFARAGFREDGRRLGAYLRDDVWRDTVLLSLTNDAQR